MENGSRRGDLQRIFLEGSWRRKAPPSGRRGFCLALPRQAHVGGVLFDAELYGVRIDHRQARSAPRDDDYSERILGRSIWVWFYRADQAGNDLNNAGTVYAGNSNRLVGLLAAARVCQIDGLNA